MNPIQVAVEGLLDAAVAERIAAFCGFDPEPPYIKCGKGNIDKVVAAYNNAAKGSPWFVLRDLDDDAACPGSLRASLVPAVAEWMCFRIPVRSIESWLLADRDRFAAFARIKLAQVPADPDALADPKQTVITLVQGSPSRELRKSMVPRPGSGGREGPLYTSCLTEFAIDCWRPAVAAKTSESLGRCLRQLKSLAVRRNRYLQAR